MAAVAPTITDAVPTASFMGMPQARTINGIRKDPPETPTMPATKPVASAKGVATQRLTRISVSPDRKLQRPRPPRPGARVLRSETG